MQKMLCTYFTYFSVPCRLFNNGNPFAKATLPQAHRVCGRRDQNLWQLPLLQPQRHAVLSVCGGARSLLCTEAQRFQSEQVRLGAPTTAVSQGSQVRLTFSILMFACCKALTVATPAVASVISPCQIYACLLLFTLFIPQACLFIFMCSVISQ